MSSVAAVGAPTTRPGPSGVVKRARRLTRTLVYSQPNEMVSVLSGDNVSVSGPPERFPSVTFNSRRSPACFCRLSVRLLLPFWCRGAG